jgi:hypothetical protein
MTLCLSPDPIAPTQFQLSLLRAISSTNTSRRVCTSLLPGFPCSYLDEFLLRWEPGCLPPRFPQLAATFSPPEQAAWQSSSEKCSCASILGPSWTEGPAGSWSHGPSPRLFPAEKCPKSRYSEPVLHRSPSAFRQL